MFLLYFFMFVLLFFAVLSSVAGMPTVAEIPDVVIAS
jgi:hypothetical protein